MEVRLAEHAGFCFGVKRAVDTVYEQIKIGKNIYTYGPIVHNEEVVKELAEKGVKVLASKEELMSLPGGRDFRADPCDAPCPETKVIIRAHGVSEEIYRILEEKGLECVDATCPFVRRIQKKAAEESDKGKHIVIVGDPGHPEVEGIVGRCKGPVTVLESLREAQEAVFLDKEELCIVAQTTFNYNKFHDIVEIL